MGKSSGQTIGYWYRVAYHAGLCVGPIDAFLEFRCGDQVAWSGEITASTQWHIERRNLFGGEKDQGGISSDVEILFGDAAQEPSVYLRTLGQYVETNDGSLLPYLQSMTPSAPPADPTGKVPAWRGMTTFVFRGGYYGAMNPYPQKPSYKVRRILNWNGAQCWYPEKAEIPLGDVDVTLVKTITDFSANFETNAPTMFQLVGTAIANTSLNGTNADYWRTPISLQNISNLYCEFRIISAGGGDPLHIALVNESGGHLLDFLPLNEAQIDPQQRPCVNIVSGLTAIYGATLAVGTLYSFEASLDSADGTFTYWLRQGASVLATGTAPMTGGSAAYLTFGRTASDYESSIAVSEYTLVRLTGIGGGGSMNPAHILYYARTQPDMGREPTTSIHDGSFRAAADWFFDQGVGLCTTYDASQESVDDFIARIEKVAACSMNRSLVDGLWYLDIANGVYDLASLPVLTDDDILDFAESPVTHDSAPNSMAVEYFDPRQKQTVTTPPVQAMALVDTFGPIEQVQRYPEIPTASLATRIVQRDLMASVTPSRSFDLVTSRKPYGWRPNTYFRLQSVKRGIADMVCLIAEKSDGTFKSGAIKLTAAQDIYSLPATSFVGVETGVDSRPPQIALPIAEQAVFEAPYFELVRTLSRADLQALPADAGFAMTVASDPAVSRDYSIVVSTDGGVTYAATGADAPWCPSALIVEGDTLQDHAPTTAFTIASGTLLTSVRVGSAALWDGEICRVDAIDATAGTLTLGRGCADTPPVPHAANSRIWFFDGFAGADNTEYTDGESIQVDLLTNTGTQQIDPAQATPLALVFSQRQNRPYPPANLLIKELPYPSQILEPATLAWAHRDRTMEADQLVDTAQPDVGPEAGVTYTVRTYVEGVLATTTTDIAGTSFTPDPGEYGNVRVEIDAVRDGIASFMPLAASFILKPNLQITTPSPVVFTYGVAATKQLQADGEHPPFEWGVDTLPDGVSVDTEGLLAYDGAGAVASQDATFSVTDAVDTSRTKVLLVQIKEAFLGAVDSLTPVAHWRLGDAVGSTSLVDRIAGAAAALTGTAGTAYKLAQPGMLTGDSDTAVLFSGGYAASAAAAKWALGTGDFSAFVIAKWTSGAFASIAAVRDGTVANELMLFTINRLAAGQVGCEGWNWSNNYTYTQASDKAYNDGKPHALGLTYEASTNTLRLYVDGALKASRVQSGSYSRPTSASMSARIANNFASQPFPGTLDEMVLFDHKLTDAEMTTLAGFVATE